MWTNQFLFYILLLMAHAITLPQLVLNISALIERPIYPVLIILRLPTFVELYYSYRKPVCIL